MASYAVRSPSQLLRSSYVAFFQLPWVPEVVLTAGAWTAASDPPEASGRAVLSSRRASRARGLASFGFGHHERKRSLPIVRHPLRACDRHSVVSAEQPRHVRHLKRALTEWRQQAEQL